MATKQVVPGTSIPLLPITAQSWGPAGIYLCAGRRLPKSLNRFYTEFKRIGNNILVFKVPARDSGVAAIRHTDKLSTLDDKLTVGQLLNKLSAQKDAPRKEWVAASELERDEYLKLKAKMQAFQVQMSVQCFRTTLREARREFNARQGYIKAVEARGWVKDGQWVGSADLNALDEALKTK